MNIVWKLGLCSMAGATLGLSAGGIASAEPVVVPFQVNPASFGNPTGSFDVPAMHCAVVVGDRPGSARITGGEPGGWGCPLLSNASWINLSTGASGAAQLSNGLNGHPAEATLNTGPGQIAVVLTTTGIVTPGLATFHVP